MHLLNSYKPAYLNVDELALRTSHRAAAWSRSQQIYVHGSDNRWTRISEIFPGWNWTDEEVPCFCHCRAGDVIVIISDTLLYL